MTNTIREKEQMCERNNLKATFRHVLSGSSHQNDCAAMESLGLFLQTSKKSVTYANMSEGTEYLLRHSEGP